MYTVIWKLRTSAVATKGERSSSHEDGSIIMWANPLLSYKTLPPSGTMGKLHVITHLPEWALGNPSSHTWKWLASGHPKLKLGKKLFIYKSHLRVGFSGSGWGNQILGWLHLLSNQFLCDRCNWQERCWGAVACLALNAVLRADTPSKTEKRKYKLMFVELILCFRLSLTSTGGRCERLKRKNYCHVICIRHTSAKFGCLYFASAF